MSPVIELPRSCSPMVAEIQQAVCAEFGVSIDDLLSARRARSVSLPRQVAMYLARELTLKSLPDIGGRFHRDHSTVIHAIRKIEASDDPELRACLGAVCRRAARMVAGRQGGDDFQLELAI